MDQVTAAIDLGLSEVGMLGNGAPQSQLLELLAKRKHSVEGWEPFHYEKVSELDFEVNGGVPTLIGGVKKWPGPHSSVMVSVAELEQAIVATEVARAPTKIALQSTPVAADQVGGSLAQNAAIDDSTANGSPDYLTVVLQLPSDEQGRKRLCNALSLGADFFGAQVTATSLADEIAVNQLLELRCDPAAVRDARERAARRG